MTEQTIRQGRQSKEKRKEAEHTAVLALGDLSWGLLTKHAQLLEAHL